MTFFCYYHLLPLSTIELLLTVVEKSNGTALAITTMWQNSKNGPICDIFVRFRSDPGCLPMAVLVL